MNIRRPMLCLVFAASVAGAQLEALKTLTPEQGQAVRQPIEARVFGTAPENFAALEAELLGMFQSSETTVEGKQYICRLLVFCASDACVPVLGKELLNPELSQFVRFTFQGMESSAAEQALIAALKEASTDLQIGIIGTLGQMESQDAVEVIARFLAWDDADVQFAAITALGHIGGKKAVKALADAPVKPQFEQLSKQARLQAVEGVKPSFFSLFSVHTDKKVYAAMLSDEDPDIRTAAVFSMAQSDPDRFSDAIVNALESEFSMTYLGLIPKLPTDTLTSISTDHPKAEITILKELADRRDRAGAAFAVSRMQSDHPEVKQAAVLALGNIGGSSAFLLIPDAPQDPAVFTALSMADADGLDEAILEAAQNSSEDKVKAKYLDCLASRKATVALPVFVEFAAGNWSRVTASAISGMANLVAAEDFKIYADLLLGSGQQKKTEALEKSIANAAQRIPDADSCAQSLVDAFSRANVEQQCAIIRSLGSIGGEVAMEQLRFSLKSEVSEIREAAVRGFCNWPDIEAADELLELAADGENDRTKVLALRAYIRLTAGVVEEPGALPMYKRAAEQARRPEELRLILAGVMRFRSEDVICFIAPLMDNPDVVNEAGQAMIEQARDRRYTAMTVQHLEHFVELTGNAQLKAQAVEIISAVR